MLHRANWRGSGTTFVPRNLDHIGVGLGDTTRNCTDAYLGDELHGNLGLWVDLVEIEDELTEVLDGVDIVVRRWGDKGHSWLAVSHSGDVLADFGSWQLTTLAGLGSLGDLDFDLPGIVEVLSGDSEPSGCDLLDGRACGVSIFQSVEMWESKRLAVGLHVIDGKEPLEVLTTLSRVGNTTDPVHGDCERLVGLSAQGSERHTTSGKSLADACDVFYFID